MTLSIENGGYAFLIRLDLMCFMSFQERFMYTAFYFWLARTYKIYSIV